MSSDNKNTHENNTEWCYSVVLMVDFEYVCPWMQRLFQTLLKVRYKIKYSIFDWVSEIQSLK